MASLQNDVIVRRIVLPVISAATSLDRELFAPTRNIVQEYGLCHIPVGHVKHQRLFAHLQAVRAVIIPGWSEGEGDFDLTAQTLHWRCAQAKRKIPVGCICVDEIVLIEHKSCEYEC